MDKQLIIALKREPYTKKELLLVLKENSSKSHDTLRKMLERQLPKLLTLGLVEKRGEKYCWYIYLNFLDENYDVKLEHSQRLIPALRRVAGESWVKNEEEDQLHGYKKINDESLETHLFAYPEILNLRQKYQKHNTRTKKEKANFVSQLNEKVQETFGNMIVESTGLDSGEYVKITLGSLIYKMVASKEIPLEPAHIGRVGNVVMVGIVRVSHDINLLGAINEFIKKETQNVFNISTIAGIKKREEEGKKIWREYQEKVLELIGKIYSGEPLKVKCRTCPDVYDLPKK